MTQEELRVIPGHTSEAADRVDDLLDETQEQIQQIENLKAMVNGQYSVNDMPQTDEFVNAWQEVSKPSEEYDFYQQRLQGIMEDENISDIVMADIYDEFTLFPQYQEMAEATVNSLQNNDVIVPALAGQLNNFLKASQNARVYQLNDFEKERQRLRTYDDELDQVVEEFERMNQYEMPLDVDRAQNFWDQLESFEERMDRLRSSREDDYDGDYNAADIYAFFTNLYGEDLGVEQPVMADLQAVDSRVDEARDNIVI